MNKLIYKPHTSLMNHMLDYLSDSQIEKFGEINYNIAETESSFILEIETPGYKKENFKISIEKDYLVVCAENQKTEEKNDLKWHRRSFAAKSFTKKFKLSKDYIEDNITANYENGILTIILPKNENKAIKKIEVK
jgi:HSP20 family protein